MNNTDYSLENLEMLKLIEKRCRETSKMRKQIERLKSKSVMKIDSTIEDEEEYTLEEDESRDSSFEDEVSFYLDAYQNLDEDFTRVDLLDALPSRKHYKYHEILLRLQAESLKEMKEIEEIILENSDISKEELLEFRQLLELEKKKIFAIREVMKPVEEDTVEEEVKNKLILVPTQLGNVRLLDELERTPKDFYPSFLELIKSIEDGTFKGVKRFTNNHDLLGVNEVKGHQVRVVFVRLAVDTYALITAFVKKSDKDKLYQQTLCGKAVDFKAIESSLKECLSDSEFMRENDLAVSKLFELLEEKNKEKRLV